MERNIPHSNKGNQMKLHLHHRPNDVITGYTNMCMDNEEAYANLDTQVDDAEVVELIANNILEYI